MSRYLIRFDYAEGFAVKGLKWKGQKVEFREFDDLLNAFREYAFWSYLFPENDWYIYDVLTYSRLRRAWLLERVRELYIGELNDQGAAEVSSSVSERD